MKATFSPDGSITHHVLHADKDGELHWHLSSKFDGSWWFHPHWGWARYAWPIEHRVPLKDKSWQKK